MSYQLVLTTTVVLTIKVRFMLGIYGLAISICHGIAILCVILFLTKYHKKLERHLRIIETSIFSPENQERSVLMASILERINQICSFKMTAWGMFPLDFSLILTFPAHLMTFTVMIINIQQK